MNRLGYRLTLEAKILGARLREFCSLKNILFVHPTQDKTHRCTGRPCPARFGAAKRIIRRKRFPVHAVLKDTVLLGAGVRRAAFDDLVAGLQFLSARLLVEFAT